MRNLKILFVGLLLVLIFSSYQENPRDQALLQSLIENLTEDHYQPQQINDEFSHRVFDLYMKRLDYTKKFLTQKDVDDLKKYRDQLDDEVKSRSFEFFTLSNDIFKKRLTEVEGYYKDLLSMPFDFKVDETVEADPEKMTFAADEKALKEAWRKYLKEQVLTRVAEKLDEQDKLKESGKKDSLQSFADIESDARIKVMKSMDDYFKRLKDISDEDRVSSFFNVIANTYDPHTEYFPPRQKEAFDIAMSGKLEGIGAQLQEKDGQIKVLEIVPGSASWREGHLKAGDVILKVAQGKGEPVDISGMKIDDVVHLIRGKKGTEVRLTVRKADGSTMVISIVRDVVVLEETFAQSVILGGDKEKIGYIRLPSFYADFNNPRGRRCSEDVKKELDKLKKENVNGIILDLRYNGGGSLPDVIQMAGLFIESGPIVQVKSRNAEPEVDKDRDPDIEYGGPLVIMVNEYSASASEIMAAAMQDYKRAVIIGTPTFGKGTVQRFYDLDEYIAANKNLAGPMGSLKITTQKFYRINGDATQIKGVVPDIQLPDVYQYLSEYEKDQDYPLPFDKISATDYKEWKGINFDKVLKNSKKRTEKSASFAEISQEAEHLKSNKSKTIDNLNLDKFREKRKTENAELKKYEEVSKSAPEIEIKNLPVDMKEMGSDTALIARRTSWQKNIKRDVYLYEAMQVIKDMR